MILDKILTISRDISISILTCTQISLLYLFSSNSLSRLQIILYLRNYLYNISLVIFYTTIFLSTVCQESKTLNKYSWSIIIERDQIKYGKLFGKWMRKFIRLSKYLEYRSSLEAFLWISNMILDDDLSLNLYVIPTTCYIVIILNRQREIRSEFLIRKVRDSS